MLDPIKEEKWAALKEKLRKMGQPPPLETFVGVELFDKNEKKIYSDIQRGNSWTRNYYNFAFSSMAHCCGGVSNNFGAGYMSSKRIAGTVDYLATYAAGTGNSTILNTGWANASAGSTFGIVVGTNAAAFDEDHYAMQTLIAHGTGAGQLSYAGMAVSTMAYTAGTKTWSNVWIRTFTNGSGGSITVAETGLYSNLYFFNTSQTYLIERNVLAPTAAVANGEILRISYTLSMGFSAID